MKTRWFCWILLVCASLAEARYKVRRPLPQAPPPPPQPPAIFKKSWPIGPRISMGNAIHMGGNFPHKRLSYKPTNYRIRRPPMFNILPATWKNQIPLRATSNNHAVLPHRPPVKEFHSMNKVPEYSPEYRPEPAILPPTHRGGIDDDKGPIHTIPAPNLSPADKPYDAENNSEESVYQRQYPKDGNYNLNLQGSPVTNFAFPTAGTSSPSQRPATIATPTQHHYEVTETNEIGQREYQTVQPAFLPPEFDVTRLTTVVNPDLQSNEVFLNHHSPISSTGLIGTNIQFGQPSQPSQPMQTNLHSSLHVGFPGTAVQAPYAVGQQIPDLHVGHPAPAGPPLSATQLYDLLNGFPHQLTEQYTTGQQPQLQQHLLQQQLGQLFQPTGVTSFSQPQMHSFNYDEQANKQQQQQQQQQLLNQEYTSGRVSADYNLESELAADSSNNLPASDEPNYTTVGSEQLENNIEYEEPDDRASQTSYFAKTADADGIPTRFYTTLPNREAAEKLAALAAAGNVNSHLIGQLRKQQEKQQSEETMPANHKEDYLSDPKNGDKDSRYEQEEQYDRQQEAYDRQQEQYDRHREYEQQQREQYYRQQLRDQQVRQDQEDNERYEQRRVQQSSQRQKHDQHSSSDDKRPLRIMVPDDDEYINDAGQSNDAGKDNADGEYEYENDEGETVDTRTTVSSDGKAIYDHNSKSEFGTRLRTKAGN